MPDPEPLNDELLRDPYEVLGVSRTATEQEIKTAYRKLALAHHPDKNQGETAESAAEKFKEIATAHSILGDPEKRRRYDAGGFGSLQKSDLEMEVDLSSLGTFSTAMAAMFSKLGVPIKTAVPPMVLEAAYTGNFEAAPLRFGEAISNRVEKAGCQYYTLDLTQRHIDQGFVIGAHSVAGSKFKLLMFEATEEGQWEMLLQEDSIKVRKNTQIAGLYFLQCETYHIGPRPSALDTADYPENMLFKRLESMQPREKPLQLRAGKLLLAVYGDNWFNRVRYTIEAVLPAPAAASKAADISGRAREGTSSAGALGVSIEKVTRVEGELLTRREALRGFEREYRQTQMAYLEAVERFGKMKDEVEGLLSERDEAYLELLAVPDTAGTAGTGPAAEDGGHLAAGSSAEADKPFSRRILEGIWGPRRQ
ncbi:DnaJ-domain-containing protein [Coccomyxa subellipsoidea C-169]|uniref:DnaJ-domain-containing protein n=1 Tax=Coccomyxa subellipsoidea (strain C-169) TaxID=574566 RepID=I0YLK1_COCSC|nr:DnaJ-domain-containing protein [Coccomyxa subellipsoidea C-169]EIE19270.1 DnaJ-domain-containing protein [Coccomyxa subellipsoidea C-169]|eukprot:XP_005643814.1 DnaJ-domain-containing protein [Coccomyxa subellipsoidea C-169]